MKKKHMPIIITAIIILLLLAASTILMIKFMKLPIEIPLVSEDTLSVDYSHQNDLMAQWEDIRVYEVKERHDTVEEIIEAEKDIEEQSEEDFYNLFKEIDKTTLDAYFEANKDVEKSYEKLLIDKADLDNTPTGIKTISGDDVLAIDSFNKILIIGKQAAGGENIKVVIVKDPKQLDLSVVENLSYWDQIETHAKKSQAILAVNANSYTWNSAGKYGTTYGVIKWHDNLIRKQYANDQIIGFTKEGDLKVGLSANLPDMYNATEYKKPLIENGVVKDSPDGSIRLARTAIGQSEDKSIIIINGAGGESSEHAKGMTEDELVNLFKEFGAVNASELSSGNKAIIYWNGRIINKTFGYSEEGIKLPTALVVKPSNIVK